MLLICLFFYGYIYLENNKVDSYSKQYKKVTINHQQLPLLMGQKVNDNLLCMESFDICKIMPFILYSYQEEQSNILYIPLTRIQSAFFDGFVDSEQSVLFFEDFNEEFVISVYDLP